MCVAAFASCYTVRYTHYHMTPESTGPFNQAVIQPASTLEDRYVNDTELQKIISDLQKTNAELETLREEIKLKNADPQMAARHTALTTKINTLTLLKEERQQAIRKGVMGAMDERYTIKPTDDPWEEGRGFGGSLDKRGVRG